MRFITSFCLLLLSCLCSFGQHYFLFVGTYTSGKSEGIYVYEFNAATGKTKPVSSISSKNPSYLVNSPDGKYLYAVNENGATQMGGVSAFAFDKSNGTLRSLNQQSSGGADPCYITENKTGRWVFVANYSSGSLSALPVQKDGRLDTLTQLIQHIGSGTIPDRQEKAHVHSTVFSPDQHYLFAADLGMDRESIYHFDPAKPQPLTAAADSFVSVPPGSGPRHFVFHPKKPYAYLIEELSGTVEVFHYNQGRLKSIQHISSHPADFTGQKGSADIHISIDGKFLYASNRGDANTIAIFSIDSTSGRLKIRGFQPILGKTPRNFMIDPTGQYLLVANQNSDNIVVFRINPATGLLKPTGEEIQVPNPVCLKMLKK